MSRPFCFECRRARSECFCDQVVPFDAGFDLALCVHPREARNAIGTARIVHRFVEGSRLFVGSGEELDRDQGFREWVRSRGTRCRILYPSADAHWIDRDGPIRPASLRPAFVVIDGTWAHAKKMLRTSAILASLTRVAFTPRAPSRYEIREQPAELCLSSLEAIHTLIELQDGTRRADRPQDLMLDTFLRMVASQIAHQKRTRDRRLNAPGRVTPVQTP